MLWLLLGMLSLVHMLMIFGIFGVRVLRRVYFGPVLAGGPTEAGSAAFLGRGLLRIRNRRLGGRAVGSRGSGRFFGLVRVMRLMCIVLSTLLTLLSLL